MKVCNNCGARLEDDMNFCTNCGSKLTSITQPSSGEGQHSDVLTGQNASPEKPKSKTWRIVKRILIGAAIVVMALILWGVHLMNSTTYMTLNSAGELYAKGGGESDIGIDYDGYVWEVTYKPSWVKIEEYDSHFLIKCSPNTTGNDRQDHITVKSGKVIQTLPVGQFGQTQFIRLSESAVKSEKGGGSIRIDMETDGSDPKISYPDFCSIEDKSEKGFTLVVPNNEGYARSGNVYVSEDNISASIYVAQQGKCPDCKGSGNKSCTACNGMGSFSTAYSYFGQTCYACGGAGSIHCYRCSGSGII